MAIVYTWKKKICYGMDVVERIVFELEGVDGDFSARRHATYVPGADEIKPRDQWSQNDLDILAENIQQKHNWNQSIDAEIVAKKAN